MNTILVVESSPMGERSVSRRLTAELMAELLKAHPGGEVRVRDLARHPLPHLSAEALAAFAVPPAQRDARQAEAARASEEAVDELLAADILVIGAPMWNFGPPSGLKAWVDHVSRAGRTFSYTAAGPRGLVKARRAFVVATSGGVYSGGPARENDFVTPYLRAVAGFLGVGEVTVVRAEGLAIPELKDVAYETARRAIPGLVGALAAA
jgi:FMN-dependent NADH-azoreductase